MPSKLFARVLNPVAQRPYSHLSLPSLECKAVSLCGIPQINHRQADMDLYHKSLYLPVIYAQS